MKNYSLIQWILIVVLCICGVRSTAFAQDQLMPPLDDLEPITGENIHQVEKLASLGAGSGGWPYWSIDGQTAYYVTTNYIFKFDTRTPNESEILDVNTPIEAQETDIGIYDGPFYQVDVSPDERFVLTVIPADEEQDKTTMTIFDQIEKEQIAEIKVDNPWYFGHALVHRYFLPVFLESGSVIYSRGLVFYQWDPLTLIETEIEFPLLGDLNAQLAKPDINSTGTHIIFTNYSLSDRQLGYFAFKIYDLRTQPAELIHSMVVEENDYWRKSIISPDSRHIISTGSNVRMWDVETAGFTFTEFNESAVVDADGSTVDIVYSPDENYFATCAVTIRGGYGYILDARTGYDLAMIRSISSYGWFCQHIAYHPSGELIAIGSEDGSIGLWRVDDLLTTGEGNQDSAYAIYNEHEKAISELSFNADGSLMLSSSLDGTAKLWDVETGGVLQVFQSTAPVFDALFHPVDKRVITTNENRIVEIWDLNTGTSIETFELPLSERNSYFNRLAISPDGSVLAHIGSRLTLWNLETGASKVFDDIDGQDIEFSRDGKLILVTYDVSGHIIGVVQE